MKEAVYQSHMCTDYIVILMQGEMWFQVKQLTASWNWQFKTYQEGKCPGPGTD